jgi:DNA-binding transcriptional ArsR family regulator
MKLMTGMEKHRRPQAETCDSDCDYIHAHDDVIQSVYEEMPEEEVLYDLAELFKVFGDSTRIKILYVLFQSEMCVCDIAQLLNMSQSAISHQLRVLKQAQLVKYRREGKTVFYSLADSHVTTILNQGLEHIEE